jgi:predicted ATPase
MAQALWVLGYADQAQQLSQEALARARQVEHLPSLEYAEVFAAQLSQCRRDVAATWAHADAAMALAAAQGFAFRIERVRIFQGWALAMEGNAVEGLAQIRQGLAASQGVGPELLRSYWLSFLAEAYGRTGQPEAGLMVLAEALMLVATTEVRWWEAELCRLKGALLLRLPIPDVQQAESCFRQALDVARGQQAKALELRVALSLSRLWQRQGKRNKAHELLTEVYGWFTEGFETPDLQEARGLLEELA